jgi:pimeloyl-ACP methyl ester carboxylesterase
MQVKIRTSVVKTPDGRDLLVESAGDPMGRTLLFFNGTPTSRKLFPEMVAEANARGAHLICYNRPGYGGSTPKPGRTVADSVNDVIAVTNYFGIERMAVWGISGGGPHTIAAATLLPDLVCAAATFASLAPFASSNFDYFKGMPEKKQKERTLYFSDPVEFQRHLHRSREDIMNSTEEILDRKLRVMPPKARVSKAFYAFSYETMRVAVQEGIEGYWEDYQAFFSEWDFDFLANTTPIQIWHGRRDLDVPYQHSEWLARAIPKSELHLTEDDGHFSILENHRVEVMEWLLDCF